MLRNVDRSSEYQSGECEHDGAHHAVQLGSFNPANEGEHGYDGIGHRVDDGQAIKELARQFARESDDSIDN